MSEIVERLRVAGKKYGMSVMREAANEIERLQAKNDSKKALLKEVLPWFGCTYWPLHLQERILEATKPDA